MNILQEKIMAIDTVHHEFAAIIQREKCSTCACFHIDVLADVYQAIQDLCSQCDDSRLVHAERDFTTWLEAAKHKTLHK